MLPYRAMTFGNAWANHRCWLACSTRAGGVAMERTGFFPGLRATLDHVLVVDQFYLERHGGRHTGPGGMGRSRAVQDRRDAASRADRRWIGGSSP